MKKKKQHIAGRQQKKNEEMAWAPPRNKSDWLDWEEARSAEKKRLEAGARGRNGGARDHHRVGCGRKHLRGP